ncbi:MAG: hypothetical protein ACYDCL_04835 [Myxococcales bacterium]
MPGRSLLGAEALPPGHFGLFGAAGFPYVTAEALLGVSKSLGLYGRFDTLYGVMEQLTLGTQWTVVQTAGGDALALRFEANQSFFEFTEAHDEAATPPTSGRPADDAQFTARWLTGQRNEAVAASLVLSTRFRSGITLSFDGMAQLTLDTEPLAGGPLSGNPPLVRPGLNTPLHVGLEVPAGDRLNFVVAVGADLHFDQLFYGQDVITIPFFALGIDGLL